jgi:tripartite ATP-independent transporter DctM subunit
VIIDALPFLMLGSLVVLLFSGLPVAIILCGIGVAFCLLGIALGEMPVAALYNIAPKLTYAIRSTPFYPAVVMLLFMGVALEKSGIAQDMLTALRFLLRRLPASMAIAVLLIGVVLAPAAGVVGASVVTLALVALPAMLRQGYQPAEATGAIAAAGTVGIILPPAVMLFFLAGQFKVPVGSMFMATVIPGALLIVLYLLYYAIRGWFVPPEQQTENSDADSYPTSKRGWLLLFVRGLLLPLMLITMVLGSIIMGLATPSQSGAIGAAGGLLLVAVNGKLSWSLFKDLARTTANLSAMVFFIIIAAAVFSYPFRYFGGDTLIADSLNALHIGPWATLLLVTSVVFVLGFFIDWIEITIITLPLFVPVLQTLDFSAHAGDGTLGMIWIAGMTALVLQTSFLTPPFGFALFFLKGSAPPGVTLVHIYRGVLPILFIQIAVIASVMWFPKVITWLPVQVYGHLSG